MPELKKSSETSDENLEQEAPDNEDSLRSLAALLSDDPESDGDETPDGDGDGEGDESHQKSAPKDLNELAKRLGVEVGDLYAIAFPAADGESHTLGELKDMLAKQDEFTVRELTWEEEKSRQEADLIRSRGELQELISALPKAALKPEILEAARGKHEAAISRERSLTLEVIPEWNDEAVRNEELTGIAQHLAGYGFPKNYLASVFDHRTMRYIRDNWKRQQRIERALAKVQEVKNPGASKKSKPGKAPKRPTSKAQGKSPQQVQRAALTELLMT